ncbi:late competence protein ComEC [Halalkalibacter wakoensis JCM 9140]|uniref:Late competence protein ComEC n=1 Tax=Halalkalibacter wakoensis JCM 9140 TaxID=1236970 RepID=W4Q4R7_9BACI|nr:DNA internalization-related competence protein ComEC/Rec2 [Halalkalibacter wakoensis]GAE27081.1 late competence protein ComEC [Halalkalibacter wakoensis JCM 9140]
MIIIHLFPLLPIAATFGLLLALRGPSFTYSVILVFFLLICFLNRLFFKEKLLVFTFVFLVYYGVGFLAIENNVTDYVPGEQVMYGEIKTIPKIDGDALSMQIKTDTKETIHVQAYFKSEEEQKWMRTFSVGDFCKINGTLGAPLPPTNFGQFNYKKYLFEQGVHWILRPKQTGIECIQRKEPYSVYMKMQRWRHKQLTWIERDVRSDFRGIMSALLFGERVLIEEDVMYAYQKLGVIHLLAVSGLHVGMIVAALFYLLIRVGLTRERTIELLIALLPIYIIIAGAAPSVIRASLMTIVVLLFMRAKGKIPPLFAIVVVYMLFILIRPFVLFHLGFQLSFLVSFGLMVSAPSIQKRYTQKMVQLLAVTVLSQLFSAPVLLFHMHEISLLSIPMNMVYIPFISLFVLPLTFLSFLISFFLPLPFNIPLHFLEKIVPMIHSVLLAVAEHKGSSFIVGKPNFYIVFMLYFCIFYGLMKWEQKNKGWWKTPTLFIFLLLTVHFSMPYMDSRGKITMIDVGQGDSFLLELPYRKEVYLIDTGGTMSFSQEEKWRERNKSFEVGKDIVVPTLKALGIRKINNLVLTHGHLDHIGGSKAVAQSIKIEQVLYGKGQVEGELEITLLNEIANSGANILFIEEGINWSSGETQFVVLSPIGTEQNLNARSIVLYVEMQGISILFTGDLEEEGENRLIKDYPALQVDILKAGHHGSRTSTSSHFLSHLKPKAVFISAGRNNRFGHPHEEVVNRLEEDNISVWRSDLHGAVQLTLKDRKNKMKKIKDEGK